MNRAIRTMTGGICALLAILVIAGGCGKRKAVEPAAAGKEAHGEGDGHGHAEEAAPAKSLEERALEHCECGVPIYQCAECRYEVGVVKLDTLLINNDKGTGLVRTQAVVRTKVMSNLLVTGEVAMNENATVHVGPRIAGIIESVPVDVGARVKAGDTLLVLASVELGKAMAEYERNKTLSELTGKVFARETKLMEQKVGSEQDIIDAQMVHEQHRTDLKASEQMLHVLGLTEDDLSAIGESAHGFAAGLLPVRASISGTIIAKHAVVGEMVEPGKDIVLLSDLTTVWVWADVHSRDLAGLLEAEKRGPITVAIKVSAFPDRQFAGVLDYIGATMSEQTRTIKVRATVKNPDMELRPGMFCDAVISFAAGQTEEVLAAPKAAVLADEGQSFVFKHWKEDFFVRQDVRKGREFSGLVEICEGLQQGDTLVAEGAFLLKSDVLREKMGAGCAD